MARLAAFVLLFALWPVSAIAADTATDAMEAPADVIAPPEIAPPEIAPAETESRKPEETVEPAPRTPSEKSVAPADPEPKEDPIERGQAIADSNCSRCHAIGKTGESPEPKAPPFRELHKLYPVESLAESLAEGIVTGHPEMPAFELTAPQVNALIGYLKTLGGDGKTPGKS